MRLAGALLLTAVLCASPSRSATGQSSPIRVVVAGQQIALAARPVVHANHVMIPLPGVFEAFGAAAVWLPQEQAIVISNRTRLVVRMRINDPYAVVDGQPRLLPIAPVVVRDVPYVPAQAIFGFLGAWVRFEEEAGVLSISSIVHGVAVHRGGATMRLVINASGPVQTETSRLINPERVVLDLRHAVFRHPDQEIAVNDGGISRIRIGQFQARPPVIRMVLDAVQPSDIRVVDSATSFDLTVEVRPRATSAQRPRPSAPPAVSTPAPPPPSAQPAPGSPAPPGSPGGPDRQPGPMPAPGATASPAPGDGVKIMQVRVEQVSGSTRVLVEGTGTMQYVVRELVDPDRLVVDVMDAVFIPVKQEVSVNSAVVENVRAAQFQADPDIARVVVTLKRKAAYTITGQEGGAALVIAVADAPLRGHAVVIDPGHGGKDPGAIGPTGLMEKHAVLDVALRVRRILVEDGVHVIMTRETDTFIELTDRPRIGRERGGTVFISIHANASTRAAIGGSETYYQSPQSLALAQIIQDELGRLLGLPSRGVRTANFLVLRENAMPTVLVEVAYISNAAEEARLRDEAFRERLAGAVARGVMRFLAIYPVPAGT